MSLIQALDLLVPPAMIMIMRRRDPKVISIGVRMQAKRPSAPMIAVIFFFFSFFLNGDGERMNW